MKIDLHEESKNYRNYWYEASTADGKEIVVFSDFDDLVAPVSIFFDRQTFAEGMLVERLQKLMRLNRPIPMGKGYKPPNKGLYVPVTEVMAYGIAAHNKLLSMYAD